MAIKTYYLLKRFTDTSEKNLPFYIENLTSNSNNFLMNASNTDATNVEYSTDNSTWTAVTLGNNQYTIPVAAYGKTYIRANATHWGVSGSSKVITLSGNCNVGGNLMSLLYGSFFTGTEVTFPDNTATNIFKNMFYNGYSALKSAEKLALPATTLADGCYREMFCNCTGLTAAPILPAATLADGCYREMFSNCTGLTAAPALPATTLANGCYQSMFSNCTGLTAAPALPATTLAHYCYQSMFSNCTGLTAAPVLSATTLTYGCYQQMFYGCTNLTAAPALPATTLANYCYQSMFSNCSNLNSVTVGATSWNTNAASTWLQGVSATGTFTKPSATNIPEGTNGIPANWTVINV